MSGEVWRVPSDDDPRETVEIRPVSVLNLNKLRDALEEVWDDGNAVGLDGFTGPGRGAGEIDNEAIYARDRVINKVLRRLT